MKSLKIKIILILSVLGLGCLTVIAVVQETERMILMIAGEIGRAHV